MGGNREYFPKIAIYRPGMYVRGIPVTEDDRHSRASIRANKINLTFVELDTGCGTILFPTFKRFNIFGSRIYHKI